MAMTKKTQTLLAVGGGLAGLLLIAGAMRKDKPHKVIVRPGETTKRFMGEQFMVRLPRGDYEMLGGEGLAIIAVSEVGNSTDLVIAVKSYATGFTVQPVFSNVDDPTKRYTITVLASPMPVQKGKT